MNLTIKDLLGNLDYLSEKELKIVEKAYDYAYHLHKGQYRQSGEEYIIHPLNVAYILSDLKADCDTICAGLLHDTLEDTNLKKIDIIQLFNNDVAELVDGVTKIRGLNLTKQDQNIYNTRKIITSITEDVRIIIIKLADRLHNMRTLQYKSELKQKENSLETMDIFVPLANYIGAYRIKTELEDLSFSYLYPNKYKEIEETKLKIEDESKSSIDEMLETINDILLSEEISHDIKVRTINIYGIYKRLKEGYELDDMHDLISLKIMVDTIKNCYQTLGLVHSKYKPVNDKFKDYIYNPKTNMYQSLHTTVFSKDGRLVQNQIRTFKMDEVASFGLTTYWRYHDARDRMQNELKKYVFYKSLKEIDKGFENNAAFVSQIKRELFTDRIYVYTTKGDMIELPKGSTVIDFAYQIHSEIGNKIEYALVNNKKVSADYVLSNNDIVTIITNKKSDGPSYDLIEQAKTTRAKRKIKECNKNLKAI